MGACTIPFSRLEVDFNGDVWLCCPTWLPVPIGNLIDDDLPTVLHSEAAESVRESARDGSYRHCRRCPFLPKHGGIVVPQPPLDPRETPASTTVTDLHWSYDRRCNLACPSCRKERFHFGVGGLTKRRLDLIHSRVLSSRVLETTRRLHITGSGDPFASDVYFDFLRGLTPSSYPGLRISLYTNGLLATPDNWTKIGNGARHVDSVEVSIDASCPETYRENRRGNWDMLCENLRFLRGLRTRGRLDSLRLSFVVQANNVREIPAFMDLAQHYEADLVKFVELANLGTYEDTGSLIDGTWRLGTKYAERAVHLPSHPLRDVLAKNMAQVESEHPDRVLWVGFQPTDAVTPPLDAEPTPRVELVETERPLVTWQDLPGYFDFEQIYDDAVNMASDGARFVEIGVLYGRSTAYMARAIAKSGKKIAFDAVDKFALSYPSDLEYQYELLEPSTRLWSAPKPGVLAMRRAVRELKDHEQIVKRFLELAELTSHVNLVKSIGQERASHYEDGSLDFVFFDTAHTYEDTASILRLYLPKLRPGGVIAGHDFYPPYEGHMLAVRDVLGDSFEVPPPWSSFVYRKPLP
ncbi:MAG TPA: class I SAM-dependent methyltransferase [Conexivisphaerales archaeon]|nr:class I SAM-dependent methyltransferase [Conexivisphaerales archaeon]